MQEELPRLESLLDHVLDVHAEEDPDALGALEKAFIALRDELRSHSAREENILFPWILSADRMPEEDPMKVMLEEHGRVDELLDEIREIAGRSRIGAGACVPWLLLGQALAELVQSLQEHRRLEEGVLFPRVAPG